MAGIFYSIQEVAEKLNISEDKVKELVKNGRLRGIPEGGSFLFKVDEIESLLTDPSLLSSLKQEASSGAEGQPTEKSETEDVDTGSDISLELEADDTVAVDSPEEPPEEEQTSVEEPEKSQSDEAEQSEIFLASTGSASNLTTEDLTSGDTALTQEGVNVLKETDSEYQVTEDTKSDTKDMGTGEPSLEQIEEDVNLDSFGSGSGLLDLSLQADDTSLGGILDDIYMSEGEEGKPAMPVEGSAVDMSKEADQIISEESSIAVPPPMPGVMPAYVEPAPNTTTTVLSVLTLLISIMVAVYTAIVVLAVSVGSIFKGFILYALGGCLVLAIVLGAASFFMTGESKTKTKKPKAKKEKKAKPKKEKKEKPKKEKKKKKGK